MIKKILSLVDQKLLRFIIVGCINTVVGTAIMFGLYNLASCSYWVSSAANYILTSILSFFLNKYFTFQNKERSWKQVAKFIINIAVCYVLAYGIAKPVVMYILSGAGQKIQENAGLCIYNLGTGHGYSVLDIVKNFEKATGVKIPYVIKPRRPGDIATCYCDPSKAKNELGWEAQYGIREMCEDSWRWQSMNPNGYDD